MNKKCECCIYSKMQDDGDAYCLLWEDMNPPFMSCKYCLQRRVRKGSRG